MNRRLLTLSLLPFALGACTRAEFSAPRTLPAEKRPTSWDTPDRRRLQVTEMRAPRKEPTEKAAFAADTPAGWETQPPQPQVFRDLAWRVIGVDGTECYLTTFVGGGVETNVNRWYQQCGATPAPMETLPVIEMGGKTAHLLELTGYKGDAGTAMMLAFVAHDDGVTSLKFTGPIPVVASQREAFLALARSLRTTAGEGSGGEQQDAAPNSAGAGTFAAVTPADFEVQPPQPQSFRDLAWRVVGDASTECYLTAFVGGGVETNVNRWYQQCGAAPASMQTLPVIEMAGQQARLLELTGYKGNAGTAMMLAFVAHDDGVTSLKFTGPEATVKQHRDGFLALARSLHLDGGSAPNPAQNPQPAGPKNDPPTAPHATTPAMPPNHAAATAAPFTATVPAGWAAKEGSPRMLHHTFGNGGEVYVGMIGGTMRQTLDIWRHDMKHENLTDAEFAALPKLPMLGGQAVLLDMSGDFAGMGFPPMPGARLLVAIVQDGSSMVYCKLLAPAADVPGQLESFRTFCASLRRNS